MRSVQKWMYFRFWGFLDPCDQNETYHTSNEDKIELLNETCLRFINSPIKIIGHLVLSHLACWRSSISKPCIWPSTMASSSAQSRLCSSCLSSPSLWALHRGEHDYEGDWWTNGISISRDQVHPLYFYEIDFFVTLRFTIPWCGVPLRAQRTILWKYVLISKASFVFRGHPPPLCRHYSIKVRASKSLIFGWKFLVIYVNVATAKKWVI